MNQFDEFVPKYYVMNPETDDILKNASELRNGMEVLIADSGVRADIDDLENATEKVQELALKVNRWGKVSGLEIDTHKGTVEFVATYSDGTKFKRWMGVKHAWLVKKDTVPTDEEILASVRGYVSKAYLHALQNPSDKETDDAVLEEISGKIVELFQDRRDGTYLETIRMMRDALKGTVEAYEHQLKEKVYSELDAETTEGSFIAANKRYLDESQRIIEGWDDPNQVIEL